MWLYSVYPPSLSLPFLCIWTSPLNSTDLLLTAWTHNFHIPQNIIRIGVNISEEIGVTDRRTDREYTPSVLRFTIRHPTRKGVRRDIAQDEGRLHPERGGRRKRLQGDILRGKLGKNES